ncbi:Protein MARD1, partial [Cucurbita argyrosperma subsp. sororia]
MLRNRSRALMADQASPVSNSLFGSPRFKPFTPTTTQSIDHSVISPTSVLDSKPFFSLQNPFSYDPNTKPNSPKKPIFPGNKQKISGTNPIGLALIEEKYDSTLCKSVIFRAKLRVKIPPPLLPDSSVDDGGGDLFPSGIGDGGVMTVKEMEVCEEYTCVRTHGPDAKITHIFDNFVVKSSVDSGPERISMADLKNKNKNNKNNKNDFLSFCYTCNRNLELTKDIYIYRGEKAFCSHECRYQEMLLDEEEEQQQQSS